MAKIVIVYHSGFGHTRAVAESVARGARSVVGSEVAAISVDELPDPQGAGRELGGRWGELAGADDLRALRRELALLRAENDILKKAAIILGSRPQNNCAK